VPTVAAAAPAAAPVRNGAAAATAEAAHEIAMLHAENARLKKQMEQMEKLHQSRSTAPQFKQFKIQYEQALTEAAAKVRDRWAAVAAAIAATRVL